MAGAWAASFSGHGAPARRLAFLAALGLFCPRHAAAAPPPPPPPYVDAAVAALTDPATATGVTAPLFATDVVAWRNGQVVARGKAAWLAWRQAERPNYYGRTIGYSIASANEREPGSLLVLDTFDTIDPAHLPPGIIMDARFSTRSALYQFGNDHLIHWVDMAQVFGFWRSLPR